MKNGLITLLLGIIVLYIVGCTSETRKDTYVDKYFQGISNNGKTNDKPYLTAGTKAYIVGTQDGLFPDLGWHVKGEMGGLWMHPLKLADGFWLEVSDMITNNSSLLSKADDYISYPHGSEFRYSNILDNINVTRFQYASDDIHSIIVEYTVSNNGAESRELCLDFLLKTDISPVWLAEKIDVTDSKDIIRWNADHNVFEARDSINNWFAVWGTPTKTESYQIGVSEPFETQGEMGNTGQISNKLKLEPNQRVSISYIVSGSMDSSDDALSKYKIATEQKEELIAKKKQHYKNTLQKSQVSLSDKKFEEAYNWIKINTQWLVMDLDGHDRFLGAGAIDYPWLFGCDNSYALQGVLATGDFDLAKSTLRALKENSEKVNGNGRILHEMSSNGVVFNKGNTQETAHFIIIVWKLFEWTGDIEFLKEFYPYIKKGINWLTVDQDSNHNLFPEGYGIMEVKDLNAELIDVSVYTQQALAVASKMASLLGEKDLAGEYQSKSIALKDKINESFWDEAEGSYCDFYGTQKQALSVAKGALAQIENEDDIEFSDAKTFYNSLIKRFSELSPSLSQGWFTNKNWVINTPIETGIAPRDRAIRNLDKIRNEHCGEYGPYLSGVEKKRMMTISTGVQAMSEAQYGRTDECLWYMDRIVSTLNRTLPGSINEMMPDYGCPVQAWTIYSVATPLITHIFGIQPEAQNKKVVIRPNLPSSWTYAILENQAVGNNIYNIKIEKGERKIVYTISSEKPDWNNILQIAGLSGKKYTLNGKTIEATSDDIELTSQENKISLDL